ncbi:MAG: diaminopimelate epimerase [Thermomicrobiales bacterium]
MPDSQDALLPDAPIPFAKMHGSGNDFVVIDHRTRLIRPEAEAAFVRAICQPRTGIGADGVVFIETVDAALPDATEAAFSWRYINADGSAGEMCGNGAMCGARFAVLTSIAPSPCAFQTPSGLVRAEVGTADEPTGSRVVLAMVDATSWVPPRAVETSIGSLEVASILVGVPHAMIVVDDADAWPESGSFDAIGRELRMHPAFAPAGTNVNVISMRGAHDLRMRTWERGVEAETLACGTGAVASAIAARRQGLVDPAGPGTVHASGGWPLTVAFTWDDVAGAATGITLSGQAIVVARGELDPEAWHSGSASAGR